MVLLMALGSCQVGWVGMAVSVAVAQAHTEAQSDPASGESGTKGGAPPELLGSRVPLKPECRAPGKPVRQVRWARHSHTSASAYAHGHIVDAGSVQEQQVMTLSVMQSSVTHVSGWLPSYTQGVYTRGIHKLYTSYTQGGSEDTNLIWPLWCHPKGLFLSLGPDDKFIERSETLKIQHK